MVGVITGCTSEISLDEYRQWLFSEESGLSAKAIRGDRTYTLTILPESWRKTKSVNPDPRLTAVLKVSTKDETLPDASFDGVTSYDAYSGRMANLAFHVPQLMRLHVGDQQYRAVGGQLSHAQGLARDISVYVVFEVVESQLGSRKDISIEYQDDVFGDGMMRFDVTTNKIQRYIPDAHL